MRQNCRDSKKMRGRLRPGNGGMNRWGTERFQSSETTLYDTVMVHTCHCTFAQTHRRDTPKDKLKCTLTYASGW